MESNIDAIIPARGGSKGVLRKNIYLLNGKPLLAYSIEAAQQSGLVRSVYVSTEDNEVARIALDYGAEVIDRPMELSSDESRTEPVVQHALENGVRSDHFVLLQATSPLRNQVQVREAIEIYVSSLPTNVISVVTPDHHPYKSFELREKEMVPHFAESSLGSPRQLLPHLVQPNGAIYICERKRFLKHHSFYEGKTLPYYMNRVSSTDIDCLETLAFCEWVLRK